MRRDETSAAILAGGRARRFDGRDKSRLVVDGASIIVRQLAVLQPVAHEVFIVASDASRFADLSVPVRADVVPGAGALGGILTAIETAQAPFVLVVACDLPFLVPPLLSLVVDRAAGADGAWIRSVRGVEPLIACYAKTAAPEVRRAVEAGNLKAANLAEVLRMNEVSEQEVTLFGNPTRLLANVNTPDDYRRIQYPVS
jgi:molybdopterin-guanine dinucleotide biosynthesis protein A